MTKQTNKYDPYLHEVYSQLDETGIIDPTVIKNTCKIQLKQVEKEHPEMLWGRGIEGNN